MFAGSSSLPASTKADDTKSGDLARVGGDGQNASADAPSQSATPGTVTSQAPRQMAENRTALPRTASTTPAIVALGVLMLALAAGMRFWSIRLG